MIQLLRYQLALHLRIPSTYAMLLLIAFAIALVHETPVNESRDVSALLGKSSLIIWVTLTFFMQMTSFFHFFFRPEALQYRLARLRSRSLVIGGAMIHLVLLSVIATLPFAIIYLSTLSDVRIALLSTMNLLVFYVYLAVATAFIVRLIGTGTATSLALLFLLFLLPLSIDGILNFVPVLAKNTAVGWMVDVFQAHLDVSSNPDMLILRGIQDTDALLRTLLLTPILATITYVRFLRGDHH